jgi:hypothetical protein
MLGTEKKKCPVCEGTNIKTQKPSLLTKAQEVIWPFKGDTKNLNLCEDCNFSWED